MTDTDCAHEFSYWTGDIRVCQACESALERREEGTWFKDKVRPNEVYIGCGVFAVFDSRSIWLVNKEEGRGVRIDHGGPMILSGALAEWEKKHSR